MYPTIKRGKRTVVIYDYWKDKHRAYNTFILKLEPRTDLSMITIRLFYALAFLYAVSTIAGDYKIIHFKGTVSVSRTNQILQITKNFPLELNNRVLTGEDLLAVIKSQRMTFKVVAHSEVSIAEKEKEILVDVDNGGVIINYMKKMVKGLVVKKRKVETPHTVMGIRGTTFFVYNLKNQTSYLTVKEGQVDLKGKRISERGLVKSKQTSFTDISLNNIRPQLVGFEKHMNWELKNLNANLYRPEKLLRAMEKRWDDYKKTRC